MVREPAVRPDGPGPAVEHTGRVRVLTPADHLLQAFEAHLLGVCQQCQRGRLLGLVVPTFGHEQVGDPAVVLVGRRWLIPVDEVAVEVDVVLVDAPHPGEPVGIEGVDQRDAHIGRTVSGVVCQPVVLQRRAGEPFDTVGARHHDQDARRVVGAERGDIDREWLACDTRQRVVVGDDRRSGVLGRLEEALT
jgi:hypothetical protein